jgi:hypothetical protein
VNTKAEAPVSDQERRNEVAAGGGGSVEIGGRTYIASQPTDPDFATLRAHLRQRLDNPLAAIAEDLKHLPAHLQREAVRAAVELKAGGGVEMTPARISDELLKPDGASFLAWLLVRHAHPEVRLEDLREHFTADSTPRIMAALSLACGLEGAAPVKATGRSGSPTGPDSTAPAPTAT